MIRLIDRFGVKETMNNENLLESIRLSEGRTVVSEIICPMVPMLYDISNPELAAAFGADIILLNLYDVLSPSVFSVDCLDGESPIKAIKRLTGRFVGVNMEPVDPDTEHPMIPIGRQATLENIKLLIEQDADFVVLTGNPKVGVTHESMVKSIKSIKETYKDDIIVVAGRMHASGDKHAIGSKLIDEAKLLEMLTAGTDVMLLPAPGTIQGLSRESISKFIEICHDCDKLVMTTIGTSQEGADSDTIKRIALMAKEAGADMHHIGDCGYGPGIAIPENIMTYSIVIKGRRHTYRRMAGSINR